MKLFTYMDHLNGTCKAHEIDQPWEPRWTSSDASLGLCDPDMVGQPKQSSGDQSPDNPEQSPDNLSDDERVKAACREHGVDIADIPAVTRLMFKLWPYSFSKTHGPLVRAEADRVEVEKAQRQSRDAALADLSATKIKGMKTGDIWLKVVLGVQRHVSSEQFLAILQEWGVTPSELNEMLEAGELS